LATSPARPPSGARRTIASLHSYGDAERAVDYLSDQGFPVERLAIVGTGLRYVEEISGRVTTWRAALLGAVQGAVLGLLFASLFGLFFTGTGVGLLALLLYGLLTGAVFGALFGLLGHLAQGGRRDFASVASTRAERYEIQADEAVADEAERLLRALPEAPAP
jgi:hypothetical protein